tara:strand:+ start:31260 stop:31658 length:399 start_codon:yes stop_codon:yes gene_type:complete
MSNIPKLFNALLLDMESFCQSCGRPFTYDPKRSGSENVVKYCSKKCRREKRDKKESFLEEEILNLLMSRDHDKTICPSEVARLLYPDDFKNYMEDIRCAGRRLVLKEKITITQKGREVDTLNFKGPIRFKLK